MGVRRSFLVVLGLVLAAVAVVTLGALAMLGRMEPALTAIRDGTVDVARVVGEPGRESGRAGATAEGPQREQALTRLRVLRRATHEALHLVRTGSWALVFLSIVCLGVVWGAMRRLERRLVAPLVEMMAVLEYAEDGDELRRLSSSLIPDELHQAARGLNRLLDERLSTRRRNGDESQGPTETLRCALVLLLDERPEAVAVLGRTGELVAANAVALRRLAEAGGDELRATIAGGTTVPGVIVTPLPGGEGFVCAMSETARRA